MDIAIQEELVALDENSLESTGNTVWCVFNAKRESHCHSLVLVALKDLISNPCVERVKMRTTENAEEKHINKNPGLRPGFLLMTGWKHALGYRGSTFDPKALAEIRHHVYL